MTGLVFLDLSKAFDTLDHSLLLDKLVHSFGFSTSAIQWFFSYLTNRSQSVCVNGMVSEPQRIDFGVPQGSALGPLPFIMYVNDISHVVRYSNVEQYADDTLLYSASDDVNIIESSLSSDLDSVTQWLSANYLKLNSTKSKIMLVGTHQRLAS